MKKLKIPLTALALMIGVAGAFATKAKPATNAISSTATVWRFDGQTLTEDKFASNYTNITGQNPPTCNDGDIPCYIVVSSGTLQNYLDSRTPEQISNEAAAQRQ